jgi:hypothetical protein
MKDTPIGYWRLGKASGTTAADSSGHGHDGTYSVGITLGQPGFHSGKKETVALFDGVSANPTGRVAE